MKRIDTPTKAVDLFGAGKHGFKDGNKSLGIAATQLDASLFNNVQEEIARVIEAAGIALDGGVYTQLLDAIRALTVGFMLVRDVKASGTDGGATLANTEHKRTLNTVDYNSILGASLLGSDIELPVGTYRIHAISSCHGIPRSSIRVIDAITSALIFQGTTMDSLDSSAVSPGGMVSGALTVSGVLTVASPRRINVSTWHSDADAFGLGVAASSGAPEVYTIVEIHKIG